MARPVISREKLREHFPCYFSKDELAVIDGKAQLAGLARSTFIREVVLGHQVIATIPSANTELWHQAAPLVANLNQIARHLNSGFATGVPPELVERLLDLVQEMRMDLLGVER